MSPLRTGQASGRRVVGAREHCSLKRAAPAEPLYLLRRIVFR